MWNIGNQAFDVITYRNAPFNSWSNGSYLLTNGLGFVWENTTSTNYSIWITGTNIATLAIPNNFSKTNWYLLADPFLRHMTNNFPYLECVFNSNTGVADYTASNFGIVFDWNDIVYTWNGTAWAGGVREGNPCDLSVEPYWQKQNDTNCVPTWTNKTPPQIVPGYAFWYYPSTNTAWAISTNLVSCNP